MDIENIDGFIQIVADYMLHGNGDAAQIAFWKAYSEMLIDKFPANSHTALCLKCIIDDKPLPEVTRRGSAIKLTPLKEK